MTPTIIRTTSSLQGCELKGRDNSLFSQNHLMDYSPACPSDRASSPTDQFVERTELDVPPTLGRFLDPPVREVGQALPEVRSGANIRVEGACFICQSIMWYDSVG